MEPRVRGAGRQREEQEGDNRRFPHASIFPEVVSERCKKSRGRALALPRLSDWPYGVSLLMRVDQFASALRAPGPWLAPPQVPRMLSPEPPKKNGPPQSV